MKCIQDCQTFLWGGTGISTNDNGDCVCTCEDGDWSTYNILGAPSCVPSRAHFLFGVIGLLTTIASLYHSAHQLNRQVRYHVHHLAASISPVEQCRRQLHVVVIIHGVLSLCYFSMVLALEDRHLWKAVVFMSGLTQFTTNIGGLLTLRMWIYTNDPRLMRETPEIMAISNTLERPAVQYATRCSVCFGAVAGTVLSAKKFPQTATKVACVAFLCTCVATDLTVLKCGISLLRTINKSILENNSLAADKTSHRIALGNEKRGKGRRVDDRLVARKNVRMATSTCLVLGVGTVVLLVFSLSSPLGMSAPFVFFAIPMAFAPPLWFGLNVQLHAGRSKRRASHGGMASVVTSMPQKKSGWSERPTTAGAGKAARSQQIAPTQGLASP